MTEISFRAWDKEQNEWLGADAWFVRSDKSILVVWPKVEKGMEVSVGFDTLDESRIALTRYIGRKDKNGKNIFEGDIVIGFGTKGIVEYFNDLTWDGSGSAHPGFYCKEWFEYKEESELSFHYGFDNCEIIGNIYENKELIEGKV